MKLLQIKPLVQRKKKSKANQMKIKHMGDDPSDI